MPCVIRCSNCYLHKIYTISLQYLYNIYTVSTQYLNSSYTISAQYLHNPPVLGPLLVVAHVGHVPVDLVSCAQDVVDDLTQVAEEIGGCHLF